MILDLGSFSRSRLIVDDVIPAETTGEVVGVALVSPLNGSPGLLVRERQHDKHHHSSAI